ncbi:hypothetical protein ALI22I_27170 [Saccharothrix sp. ALI-22-I]|uniref:RICIN domain-containing protein n=1 Tax=Saccharothrix sp. ALI-22-I TaxID=1933778 RepID=UPI00097BBB88|nr:RICIN domain-containing protein [Saccharothrix sp. ALI-22-I]ONI85485.1 hypothetical protein ALI22I_27170 [Saccharothrix sp. ALI-22-I]
MEGLAPPEVRDAAEFAAALREPRVRTGLSYRQLERRAVRAGDDCGAGRADQTFTLEPTNGGYRLRSIPGSAYCTGVLEGCTDPGVQLIQGPCTDQAHQLFVLG